ncbi:MAG: biotin/lipoyl-binding protein, partial [Lentisphaeria bacterium]|nr:biotin/lipoyl-binding protein [Lentisphaeria bacterium]
MKIETFLKTLIAGWASLCGAAVFAQGIPTVSVADVSEVTETGIKQYIGRLSAIQDVALPARVSGKLIKCNFKEGDFVKKGDLLMVLE